MPNELRGLVLNHAIQAGLRRSSNIGRLGKTADPRPFVEPVAKIPEDRAALLEAAVSGNPKFFLGSDSAPHRISAKQGGPERKDAAGVFTAPYVVPLVLDALEEGCRHGLRLEGLTPDTIADFLSGFGRAFYRLDKGSPLIDSHIEVGPRDAAQILDTITNKDQSIAVVPFRSGQRTRSVKWC